MRTAKTWSTLGRPPNAPALPVGYDEDAREVPFTYGFFLFSRSAHVSVMGLDSAVIVSVTLPHLTYLSLCKPISPRPELASLTPAAAVFESQIPKCMREAFKTSQFSLLRAGVRPAGIRRFFKSLSTSLINQLIILNFLL